MRWPWPRVALIGVDAFAAASAIGGGAAVMAGWIQFPQEWLTGNWWNWLVSDYWTAGAILLVVTGGSALAALIATLRDRTAAAGLSLGAGLVMIGWIAGEVIILNQYTWLQALYLANGLAMVLLSVAATDRRLAANLISGLHPPVPDS